MKYKKPKLYDMKFQTHAICADGASATGNASGTGCAVGSGGDGTDIEACLSGGTNSDGAYLNCNNGAGVSTSGTTCNTGSSNNSGGGS